jgi:hypothetical protein
MAQHFQNSKSNLKLPGATGVTRSKLPRRLGELAIGICAPVTTVMSLL